MERNKPDPVVSAILTGGCVLVVGAAIVAAVTAPVVLGTCVTCVIAYNAFKPVDFRSPNYAEYNLIGYTNEQALRELNPLSVSSFFSKLL
jgi:hypothetical protein